MCLFKTIHVEIPECRVYKQLIIPEKCWQVIRMKVFFFRLRCGGSDRWGRGRGMLLTFYVGVYELREK